MANILAVLKASAPIERLPDYPHRRGLKELEHADLGERNGRFHIFISDPDLDPPEFSKEVQQHIAFYLLNDEVVGLEPHQGEHLEDDARAMVINRTDRDEGIVSHIKIRAATIAKALQLRSDILAGKAPTRPYRTAPRF